jgi:DNA-binding MarR family transcriptional regulator
VTGDVGEGPAPPELDRLIHEPARLMITAYLAVVERADMLFVQRQTGFTMGNLSSHVSKLEAAGYVEVEKTFRGKKPRTMLRLTERGRAALNAYRARMQSVLRDIPGDAGGTHEGA